ncbi:hypothetical protein V8F20_011481 [Naviculisporaceae sp. PSN 640]
MEAMLFEGRLRTRDPSVKEYLHVYADDADNGDSTNNTVCYDLIISATNRSERIHRKIDTSWVHLGPANPNTVAGDEVYPLKLKQIRLSSRERGDTIFFLKKGALLSFQQLITGNRVVHDLSGVTITCQYSRNPEKRWKVWEGSIGQSHLAKIKPLRHLGCFALAQSLALDSLKATECITTVTQFKTMYPRCRLPVRHFLRRRLGPNRSRTTSRPLSTRPSSVTSGGGISVISLDMKGKKGTIIQTPEAPSLVLLRRDGLLLIDINNDIETDPSLCDCERERKESASPSCTVVVLKTSEEGPKDIPARRTPSSTGLSGSGTEWNLAAAGRSQRKIPGCLEDVKHLRLLALDFKSVHDRLQFVQYFENLKTIYLRKLQGKW